jgi:biopolymer transport protein ExbD
MKIGSPWPEKKARIEIIPLIDIMFFLLASFMMASLTMIRLQSIKMNLPTAAIASSVAKPPVNITVKKNGDIWIDNKPLNVVQLHDFLTNKFSQDTNLSVYITGDPEAHHGRMIEVLDRVRQEGIQQVSFAISLQPTSKNSP